MLYKFGKVVSPFCSFCMKQPETSIHLFHTSTRCSVKNVFLEISQDSQENTCTRVSFLIKLQAEDRCFPVNFANFLRTPFLKEHLRSLLLSHLRLSLQDLLIILLITPQSAIFGFTNHEANFQLINYFLLVFKYFVYNVRENGSPDLNILKRNINKGSNIEMKTTSRKKKIYFEIYRGAMGGRMGIVISLCYFFFFQFVLNIGCCLFFLFISCINFSCLAGFSFI